jgi:hypothetical protein
MAMPLSNRHQPDAILPQHSYLNCLSLDLDALGLVRYRSSGSQFKNANHEHAYEESDESRVTVEFVAG